MNVKSTLVGLILLSVPHVALSAQNDWKVFLLPPTIETKQEVKTIPAGWVTLLEAVPNQVAGITVFDGRPEQKASLVPDNEEKQKAENRLAVTWRLAPLSSEGAWLTLSYASTSVVLARPLPEGTTELRVFYDTSVTICGKNEIVRVEYR
jgi:hypothetical protein